MTYYDISVEIDNVLMEIAAVRHIFDEVCEPCKNEADKDLHGGLQRVGWYALDNIKATLEGIGKTAFDRFHEVSK